jgi:hypothetical protein
MVALRSPTRRASSACESAVRRSSRRTALRSRMTIGRVGNWDTSLSGLVSASPTTGLASQKMPEGGVAHLRWTLSPSSTPISTSAKRLAIRAVRIRPLL